AAIAAFLVAGLFEYNFGDTEVLLVAVALMALPFGVQRDLDEVTGHDKPRWRSEAESPGTSARSRTFSPDRRHSTRNNRAPLNTFPISTTSLLRRYTIR